MEPGFYWVCLAYDVAEKRKRVHLCCGTTHDPVEYAIEHNLGRATHSNTCRRFSCHDNGIKWQLAAIVGPFPSIEDTAKFAAEMGNAPARRHVHGAQNLTRVYEQLDALLLGRQWPYPLRYFTARRTISPDDERALLQDAGAQTLAAVYATMQQRLARQQTMRHVLQLPDDRDV